MAETVSDTASTRAELLQQQRAELARLSRRRWALRRLVLPALVSFALVMVVFSGARAPDGESSVGRAVACAVVLAVWAAVQWRHVRTTRGLEAQRTTWMEADRTPDARSLPAGDLDPALATMWDARDDDDLEQVARTVGLARQVEIYAASPVVSMVLGAMTGILATIAIVDATAINPIAGGDRVIAATVFGAIAVSGWVLTWTSGREYWRRQLAWNQVGLEREVYLERRRVLHGIETAPDPQLPAWARPLAAIVLGAVVVLVVVRVASASAAVLLAAVLVLLLAGLLIAAAVVRAQRLHVVPLRAGGGDVLSSPVRRVRVEIGSGSFTITDVSGEASPVVVEVERVRHALPLQATYPWVPGPLLVVTDDEPLVLAGRGTGPLRNHLT